MEELIRLADIIRKKLAANVSTIAVELRSENVTTSSLKVCIIKLEAEAKSLSTIVSTMDETLSLQKKIENIKNDIIPNGQAKDKTATV